MTLPSTDQMIVRWAIDHGYPCTWSWMDRLEPPYVTVSLDHAMAFFQDGSLVRVVCRRDGRFVSEMARELAVVFALCGCVAAVADAIAPSIGEGQEKQVCAESP